MTEENFNFSIDETLETTEESFGSSLEPGIHHGIILKSIEYKIPDVTDNKAAWEESIDFIFESTILNYLKDSKGNLVMDSGGKKIIISRIGDSITNREFYSASKMDEKKQKNLLKRLKHVMIKFLPLDEVIVSGSNFKELAEAVIDKLSGKFEDKKLRLKVIKQGNYNNIPKYMPFIENMEKLNSQLQLSKKELEGEAPNNLSELDDGGEIIIPDDL